MFKTASDDLLVMFVQLHQLTTAHKNCNKLCGYFYFSNDYTNLNHLFS